MVLRAALLIIVVATMVGALMPSRPTVPSAGGNPAQADSGQTKLLSASESRSDSGPPTPGPDGSVTLERNGDGHFYAEAKVNGASIRFLVDTGASGVALAQDDARRAGIPVTPSDFEVVGQGASGEVRGQPVSLERVSLGHKESVDLPAVVLEGSEHSLLGQDFLRQFRSVSIEGDRMVLR